MSNLPEKINVMQVMSYDVSLIVKEIEEHRAVCENPSAHGWGKELTVADCIDWIQDSIDENFSDVAEFAYTNEKGEIYAY